MPRSPTALRPRAGQPSPVRARVRTVGLVGALAVMLVSGEIGLRVADAPGASEVAVDPKHYPVQLYRPGPTGFRLAPGLDVTILEHNLTRAPVRIHTNSLGHRHRELGPRTPGELRVLVLGDSITLGDYQADEETYPRQLEGFLRDRTPGQPIEVINAGVGGIDLITEFNILRETGLAVEPDVVLVGLYLNDWLPSPRVSLILPEPYRRSRLLYFWYSRIAQVQTHWAPHRVDHLQRRQQARTEYASRTKGRGSARQPDHETILASWNDWGAAWSPEAWVDMGAILTAMHDLGGREGFRLAVALFPVRPQVLAPAPDTTPQRLFVDVLTRLGIPHLDLLPALREGGSRAGASGEPLYFDVCHLTARGNAVVARRLADFLTLEGLVPPAASP